MADQPIHEPKDFSAILRLLQTTDPVREDTFNPLFERLINNDAFMKALIDTHLADYAQLNDRVNNLRTNDIQARQELLDIKIKLDELQVVDFINKTGIGYFDLFTDTTGVDLTNTTATVSTTNADVVFSGHQTLKMKPQIFDAYTSIELALYDVGERETISPESNVSNNTQLQVMLSPGSLQAGEKLYHNGEVYTVTAVQEVE